MAPFEIVAGAPGLVLSCEHASNALPDGWSWPAEDRWVIETHWAWDIGAAEITRGLAARLGAPAILSRFSRLLVDPNREPDSPTLIREVAEGRVVHLNRDLSPAERDRRLDALYRPYHEAFDRLVADHDGPVLSIHTFTPVYEGGPPREVEIGVLFDRHEEPAVRLERAIATSGMRTALNEPYSGRHGLIFACQSHADRHGRVALELEIRQDLAGDPARRPEIVAVLAEAVRAVLSPASRPSGSS